MSAMSLLSPSYSNERTLHLPYPGPSEPHMSNRSRLSGLTMADMKERKTWLRSEELTESEHRENSLAEISSLAALVIRKM